MRGMGHPVRPLEASVDIAAPPEAVWRIVSDVRRTGEWSPECRKVLARAKIGQGSRFVGINRRGPIAWPTNAKVTRFDPPRTLAYRITENGATWTYDLQPTETGTRLTERRDASEGITGFSAVFTRIFLGGNAGHSDELESGIRQGLARIKTIAEARP